MKKNLCCFLTALFVTVFLFSGCSNITPKHLQFAEEFALKESRPLLMEDNFLLCCEDTVVSDGQISSTDIEYFVVNLQNGEQSSLGKLTDVIASSGDVLYAPDGNFYLTYQTANHPVSLYKLSPKNGEINLVYESTSSLPFQFLSILDENNLVLFEPDGNNSSYTYRVIIYNLSTEKTTVVLERTTVIGEEGAEQISSAFAYNGEIYCLMHRIGGEYKIDVLNTAGTLDRTIALDSNQLREATTANETEYGIWRIYITDGIVWFKTLANTIVPFSMSTGSLCGEILQGYVINPNLSNPDLASTLFYRTQKSEITMFSNTNGTLERYDLTVESDGKVVSIGYAFYVEPQNKIGVIPWNNANDWNILLYELK